LQEHNADQKETHQHVQKDDKTEEDIHVESCFPGQSG
jgi:hypothetical protein